MTSNAENEITSFYESVLYLWRGKNRKSSIFKISFCLGHNIVNQRLRSEEYSNDPNWPKIPFPTKQQCNSCVQQVDENGDAMEYNEKEVYQYFKEFYYLQNSGRYYRCNYLLLFFIFMGNIFIFNKEI
jgi:hypothetical protein